jgi:hypothetical protein
MTKTTLIMPESINAAAVHLLALAASPTFAIMALLTVAFNAGQLDLLCAATQHGGALDAMVVMYSLMSAFHSPPWLKLIFSRRNGIDRPALMQPMRSFHRHQRVPLGQAAVGITVLPRRRSRWPFRP